MSTGSKRFMVVTLLALLVVTLTAGDGFGIWRNILVEYFDKDQSDRPTQQWPWNAPVLQLASQRWFYNPWPPYYRYSPNRTDFSWGVQNYIYNSYIRQREEFPQSIWCAVTNRSDINRPRFPEHDLYEHNQNAWAWWGPFSLRNAVNAGVSFWYYVDVQYGTLDSLSVVVVNNPDNLTLNGRDFRTTAAFGAFTLPDSNHITLSTFPFDERDWHRREFYLDSLRLLNAQGSIIDTVSYIGERELYLCFVWQSNERGIDRNNGKGAFIDDVQVMWDDGLFEIQPFLIQYGYPVNEEVIDWRTRYPGINDEIKFRLQWKADGFGECGPFSIALFLDDQEIYREERTVIARADTTFITEADTLWEVTAGEHTVRWVIDVNRQIDESDENNNVAAQTFTVEWNPPPEFSLWTPSENPDTLYLDLEEYPIQYTVTDSNETDLAFTIYLFWTEDITGLDENPNLIYDYHYLAHTFDATRDDTALIWNPSSSFLNSEIEADKLIYICGFASDGRQGNETVAVAPGRIWTMGPRSVKEKPKPSVPMTFGLTRAYPNPFNKSLMIEYSTLTAGKINLAVFDLTGRRVQTLIDGNSTPGFHAFNWSPDAIGAGVYLVRLETAGKSSIMKTIYTP